MAIMQLGNTIQTTMTFTPEKIRQTLTSPTIYIDIRKSQIEARAENFLFCTSGHESKVYQNIIVIDTKGTLIKVKNVKAIGKIKLWTSLKYFSPVKEVLPNIEGDVQSISVDDFKRLIIETISKKPGAWSNLDTLENITREINNCKTYKDIIVFFNPRLK